ncbi:Maintenance of mitochondrial morphology protein 1 [Fusarium oxysporum f. sp. cubense race 1]|uniref:Maintenance of mitochondrial morphology protein 1 n=1 Tax=Fusarium oxysporum f. sp. cubense (strain race 1) TaxID=1229664 RepID=N4V0Q2_FUSC1|nr:Maintenance of mitochondrial morphology protein 1 [Fusarium oxysporum f. sp. cubense race 1]
MEADTCPRLIEPTLSFTQGLIVGQLSVVLVLAAFIKFFIFGDPPSADVTASLRATERRSRTLAHKRSLLSIRSPANRGDRSQDRSLSRKKSTVLRNPPTLTIGSILSKAYYNVDSHQPESLDWFNVLIAQTIAQFRSDAQHDDAILDSLTKALNGDSRPDFIDEIRVTELSLGEDFPILSNCRIIPVDEDGVSLAPGKKFDPATAARDGLRLQARMDVDLSDMLTLAVRTKLILNYPKKLSAVLPVELAVSVIRLDFEIRSLLGSRSKLHNVPKIAQLVEARLHRWFDERAVEPRFQEIALPSLWPRKKNTRGPEDASTERSESIGRSRGNDAGRDHREEIRGRGGDAEIRDRGAGGTVRHRRGTRSNDSDDFSMPGSLPDFQVAAS